MPGPWEHRFVGAHAARFHVAAAEPPPDPSREPGRHPPLVLLLHGSLQNWWAWRHVLPLLAAAGYRAVAADLRGHGASDATPRGYDQPGLADDVEALVRSLGHARAVVVGHDLGGWVGWTLAHRAPERVAGLVTVAAPPPAGVTGLRGTSAGLCRALLAAQVPVLPEHRLLHRDALRRHLDAGRPLGSPVADDEAGYWRAAVRVPSVAHTVLEPARWLGRSRLRPDGARWRRSVARPPAVPWLAVHGREDRLTPRAPAGATVLEGAGHQVPEEAPDGLVAALLPWLRSVAPLDA
ncbi:alpha/beta fold hydrolase [Aquipuribacter sp. SD81]|uniref:alpha/beta fold hydrolase n=1 Tax=Aquipuribacter sp. SD81 TaxID=3127703 RepID=UPI0030174603